MLHLNKGRQIRFKKYLHDNFIYWHPKFRMNLELSLI